ncbi:amino-acid oxidase [Fusarium mundagurra]|uniref:Amino-acid oxidase n=1 Tax=Fusarium mundagurra TaxID=1567541 RepID=A0A8H6D8H5_9HYPO|nr:amino-acid oxidase [Fusarium mundagurra]
MFRHTPTSFTEHSSPQQDNKLKNLITDSSNLDRHQFLTHEVHSESTIPLIQYFIKCQEEDGTGSEKLFHDVKGSIGHHVRDRDIPDEAVQLQEILLSLTANGPRKDGEELHGSPTVTIVGAGVSGLCAGYKMKKAGFKFEIENKFIHISGYGETITYEYFNYLLKHQDGKLLALFPGLRECEKGKTCDDLFAHAVKPVMKLFWEVYKLEAPQPKFPEKCDYGAVKKAYAAITEEFGNYTLRPYLTDVAGWTEDALNVYDLLCR